MMWDIDQMKALSATVVLSLFKKEEFKFKERTTVALKGFIWSIFHIPYNVLSQRFLAKPNTT